MAAITARIEAASPPHGNEWDLQTVVDERIHVSRTSSDRPVIFVEGGSTSFGNYSRFPGTRHVTAKDMETGRVFESLQIMSPPEVRGGAKALAHIVYEMASILAGNPEASNEELLLNVRWVLGLLGGEAEVLSPVAQLGLAGECVLLRELLEVATKEGVGAAPVLERWVDEERDFAARGISVEVKTTSQNTRLHHIGSINQLEPVAEDERVYLYSLGIKVELLHDRKLTHYVDEVVSRLVMANGGPDEPARAAFAERLEARGYLDSHRALYDVGPGLMVNGALPARLYQGSELEYLRTKSFKNDSLPSMVRNIGYDLELPDGPDHQLDEAAIFLELITSPPLK